MKKIYSLLLIVIVSLFIAGCSSSSSDDTTKKVALAQCLTEKGTTMYGALRCSHCNAQKEAFGYEAFAKINFVDCDKNKNACGLAGVEAYPTRVFPNKSKLVGEQSLEALAQAGGCEYTSSSTGVVSTNTGN